MDKKNLFNLRKEFTIKELSEDNLKSNPFEQFDLWFSDALKIDSMEANIMFVATSSSAGIPSLRTVLLKEFDENGFVFFTNYTSRKGKEIRENPNIAVLFYWNELERQVRIEGVCEKVSSEESVTYFNSRPFDSRISATVSEQSKIIENRDLLESKFSGLKKKYEDQNIPKPEHWGGYRLKPINFEFWQGRENRLHDRIQYSKDGDIWNINRLSP
ncbi:MAG TPA: pyridoxamine 5'-phosphate oxidase [Ignavibacteria bacterium]|nr:pyridoxamine 5'-phosphate oxidase [Ignavibacteria bacterium]